MLPQPAPADSALAPSAWRRRVLALGVALGAGLAGVLWWWPHFAPRPTPRDEQFESDTPTAAANPGFVGIHVCAECHDHRAAEFRKTRHFLACTPASGAAAPGFAPGRGVHVTRDEHMRFEMSRTGDQLLATGIHTSPLGERRVDYHIGLVYGAAGHGDEMYHAWQGDKLSTLPVAWLYPLQCWGNAVDSIDTPAVVPSCLDCHNTWVAHVPGAVNQYRKDDMLLGVTCERCHGPGKAHVAHHRAHPKDAARSIVHPGQLSRDRLMDVCSQCHSNVKQRGPAFSYRPGEPLEEYYRSIHTQHPEDEIVANQERYLRLSKCFQKSEMTCVTCHDPHRPNSVAVVHRACLKCHTPSACADRPNLPAAVRDDCVGCHMPSRVWMNVRYHTKDDEFVPAAPRADHRIGKHPEAKQAVLLAWLRDQDDAASRTEAEHLATQLTQHWLSEADQRRRDGRLVGTIGAMREAIKVEPSPATRARLREAIAELTEFERLRADAISTANRRPQDTIARMKQLLALRPNYAPAYVQLGIAHADLGDREKAIANWRAVAEHDPENVQGIGMLAKLAYLEGRAADAAELCAQASRIEPLDADVQSSWGLALLRLDRWAEAAARFRHTLTIDPRHAAASQGLSEALRRQGQAEAAIAPAERAARWTQFKDASTLLTLAEAYSAAGRPADARATLEQALKAAEPELVPWIQERLRLLD